jgi:hypothetical protein
VVAISPLILVCASQHSNRLYLRLCKCTTDDHLVCELKPLNIRGVGCRSAEMGFITSVFTVPIGWILWCSVARPRAVRCGTSTQHSRQFDSLAVTSMVTTSGGGTTTTVEPVTLRLTQAPSPESNPNSPSPVNATVVHSIGFVCIDQVIPCQMFIKPITITFSMRSRLYLNLHKQ